MDQQYNRDIPLHTPENQAPEVSKKSPLKQAAVFFVGGLLVGGMLSAGVLLNRAPKVANQNLLGENLFKVDGNLYSSSNLPSDSSMPYFQLENSIYDAKMNFLNQIALRVALSKDSKETSDELPALDSLLALTPVTDAEVQEYYKNISERYGQAVFGNQPIETIKTQLKQQLTRQKHDQAVNAKLQELTASGRIVSLLVKPEAPPVKLNVAGYPTRGNENAPVTLVEVSDYMCPHCRETEGAVEKIYKEFGDKVKFVQVSFPLNMEGLNGALARGAYCAHAQGKDKFWNYHQNAFQVSWEKMKPVDPKVADKFFNDETVAVATQSGLDMAAFNACLVSEDAKTHLARLKKDFNSQTGFQGTPTFYLNNKLVQANPAQLEETLRSTLKQLGK